VVVIFLCSLLQVDYILTLYENTGPFDDVDGSIIFGGIESFVPTIQDILSRLVAKKADFVRDSSPKTMQHSLVRA
jgi:hypothetical protein